MTTLEETGEFGFIDRIAAHGLVRPEGVICGIGDDCAVFEGWDGEALLLTTDLMVEGVHFLAERVEPEALGHKLLAVNLSDIAAMGGEPRDAVVSVAAAQTADVGFLEGVYRGLASCAGRYGVNIAGGDTTRSPGPLVLNLSLLGRMPRDQVCLRSGARPGDLVFVSGDLGDAAAGLALILGREADISDADRARLRGRHTRPEPRVELGRSLAGSGVVTAMIDLSDGLASDLRHICDRSGVSAVVDRERIPLSPALRAYCEATEADPAEVALTGGEDYELLFSVRPDAADTVEAIAAGQGGPAVARVGVIEPAPVGLFERDASGSRTTMVARGFDHFRKVRRR